MLIRRKELRSLVGLMAIALSLACSFAFSQQPTEGTRSLEELFNSIKSLEQLPATNAKIEKKSSEGGFANEVAKPKSDSAADETQITDLDQQSWLPLSGAEDEADVAAIEQSDTRKKLEIFDNYELAVQQAQVTQRPIFAVLGAKWCSWCRKLEKDLEDSESLRSRWIIVKVDVDENPGVAQELNAVALPGLRVLGADQEIVAQSDGYKEPAELESWLSESLELADPVIQRVLYESGKLDQSSAELLIGFLGDRNPRIRSTAQQRIIQSRGSTAGLVVDALRSGSLAQQLSAIEVLKTWDAPVNDVDPWIPESRTEARISLILEWLKKQSSGTSEDVKPIVAPSQEEMQSKISELLEGKAGEVDAMIAFAVRFGSQVVPSVKQMLIEGDKLSDTQRTRLREVLYRAVSGAKMNLEKASQIKALASLSPDLHRKAAKAVVSVATSEDEALLDELSIDPDPLVREMAVMQLGSIGAIGAADRVTRLLQDKSPIVRTAVLRALAEDPQRDSLQTLLAFLESESEEDLLVLATKTLGEIGKPEETQEALAKMLSHASWRVRAAVLDTLGSLLEQGSDYSYDPFGGSRTRSNPISNEVIAQVLECIDDSDQFVVEKAKKILPNLVSEESTEVLAEFLFSNPECVSLLTENDDPYRDESTYEPLIRHVLGWMENDDPKRVRAATLICAELAPTRVRNKIPFFLEASESSVRIAGVQVLLESLSMHRVEELEAYRVFWEAENRKTRKPRKPLYEIAENWILEPPTRPSKVAITEEKVSEGIQDIFSLLGMGASPDDPTIQASETPAMAKDGAMVDEIDLNAIGELLADLEEDDSESSTKSVTPDVTADSDQSIGDASFDSVLDLFGEVASTTRPQKKDELQVNSDSAPELSATDRSALAIPSVWLERWFSSSQQGRSESWISEADDSLQMEVQKSAEASDDAATDWLELGAVVLGQQAVNELPETLARKLRQPTGSGNTASPALIDLIPWLESEDKLNLIRGVGLDLEELPAVTDEFWLAATEIESKKLADWIFSSFSKESLEKEAEFGKAVFWLTRSLVGSYSDEAVTYFYEDSVSKPKDGFVSFRGRSIPTADSAIAWLAEKYELETNSERKAVLLAVSSRLDHRFAAKSSVGLISQSLSLGEKETSNLLFRVACMIALGDVPRLSVHRAEQMLNAESITIVNHATNRLLQDSDSFSPFVGDVDGIPSYYEYDTEFPGIYYLSEPASEEIRNRLYGHDLEKQNGLADLLSIAAGEEGVDLDLVAKRLERFDHQLLIAIALSKSKRSDEEVAKHFRKLLDRYVDESDNESIDRLYSLIRQTPGEAFANMRKEMRRRFGGNLGMIPSY